MRRRQCQRFTKRFESTFSSDGLSYRGISSDLSAGGLFIRTQNGFMPGTIIDIAIYLPDNKLSSIKGIVRRTIKIPLTTAKNGMGVELIERDSKYLDILKDIAISGVHEENVHQPNPAGRHEPVHEPKEHKAPAEDKGFESIRNKAETVTITCQNCKVKNRVYKAMLLLRPKCGKCGEVLDTKATD